LGAAILEARPVIMDGPDRSRRQVQIVDGAALRPGHEVTGPALVVYPDTTLLLPSGDRATMDAYRNLVVLIGDG
jgi:N-methylhydantoinase A